MKFGDYDYDIGTYLDACVNSTMHSYVCPKNNTHTSIHANINYLIL